MIIMANKRFVVYGLWGTENNIGSCNNEVLHLVFSIHRKCIITCYGPYTVTWQLSYQVTKIKESSS